MVTMPSALGPASVVFFLLLVALVAVQRIWELARSRRHEVSLRARGARESAGGQMAWMRALHTAWLVAIPIEVVLLDRPFEAPLALAAFVVFLCGQALRLAAMHALGDRWSVKVLTVPDAPPISGGIFRFIRHPNYLGVVLEIAALPMIHGAWLTAVAFSAANALLLVVRIRAEEAALRRDNAYDEGLGDRPRWFPRLWGRS